MEDNNDPKPMMVIHGDLYWQTLGDEIVYLKKLLEEAYTFINDHPEKTRIVRGLGQEEYAECGCNRCKWLKKVREVI